MSEIFGWQQIKQAPLVFPHTEPLSLADMPGVETAKDELG